ncbi:hypothetical protein IJG44_09950 [bacterium]|nr:hypothetical protein [bacterium]
MKKFLVSLIVLALCLFTIACNDDTGEPECNPDEEECDTDTNDPTNPTDQTTDPTTEPTTDPTTDPTTEPSDEPTNPTDDPEEPASTGVITQIQKGEIAEGTEVTTECVVTGIYYAQDNSTHENTAIKGLYVSELVTTAQPYSGIYVFIKATAALDEYAIGDKLEVSGKYSEYHESSQIEAAEIKKLGTADVPEPAEIEDPAKIATPFEENEASAETCKWEPTANHGADTEAYESVLVKVTDVAITNANICHGAFEVTGNLAVDKTLYYYKGKRSEGKEFESIQGILIYSYDAFRLAPRAQEDFVEGDNNTTDPTDPTVDPTEPAEVEATTIKDIQSGKVEKETAVKIENAIVISPAISKDFSEGGTGYSFYVSDGNTGDYSGLYIYLATAEAAPAKGDKVTIEGKVLFYGGSQWEIGSRDNVTCKMTKTGTGTAPAIVKKAYADLTEKDKGTYIEITDTNLTVESVDANHKDVTFTNGLVIKPNTFKINLSLKAGDTVSKVKGIYDNTFSTPGLVIVDANDVTK